MIEVIRYFVNRKMKNNGTQGSEGDLTPACASSG